MSRRKIWCFRFAALLIAPILLFALAEVILRIAGFGYPTCFLLNSSRGGTTTLIQNNQFGWRFFGRELSRAPWPLSISATKPPSIVRVFVLGESAAKGDPSPAFGLAPVLEAILRKRHPQVRFEIINAAMTAINSHAILPIARDCSQADSDVWVIYMGNNEVVGPYGAGTIFGRQSPPLPLIRAGLKLKETHTGQLLDFIREQLQRGGTKPQEWRGMEMFLSQQVRSDDPRLAATYRNFESNLRDMLGVARKRGIGVVLCTVAVNLKDFPPFASQHAPSLGPRDVAKWDEYYQHGIAAWKGGDYSKAMQNFQEAGRLDNTFGELRFLEGQCALALNQESEASDHFRAARDFDTLRFRCDSSLNEVIRRLGSGREKERILLADAERAFAEQSRFGLPGEDLFYEHAHFTFQGTYLLARAVAEKVERLVPERITNVPSARDWPSLEECAAQLAWSDWEQLAAWKGIMPRLRNPPFVGQWGQDQRMKRLESKMAGLSSATQPQGLMSAKRVCDSALSGFPQSANLYSQLASIERRLGDLSGAEWAATKHVELLPSDGEGWSHLGSILAREGKFEEARTAFGQAVNLDPQDIISREAGAQVLSALGKQDSAIAEFQRVIAINPRLGLAWLHLGQARERKGLKAEADPAYRQAAAMGGPGLTGTIEIAGFCQGRGWFEEAARLYEQALALDPANSELHLGAGQNLAALNRLTNALEHSAAAARLAPDFAEAHLLHGLVLGRLGNTTAAAVEFRKAVNLKPGLLDARLNLGVALGSLGQGADALEQFDEVLRLSPTNAQALKYVRNLRQTAAPQNAP